MNKSISFYFTYETEEEREQIVERLVEVFGEYVKPTLRDDNSEKIAHVKLKGCNEENLFDLLREFDGDELRVLFVADELIIGTARCLDCII